MRRTRLLTLAATALAVAACETSTTDPQIEESFDAQAVLADYETMGAVIEGADWAALEALEGRMPFGSTPTPAGVVSVNRRRRTGPSTPAAPTPWLRRRSVSTPTRSPGMRRTQPSTTRNAVSCSATPRVTAGSSAMSTPSPDRGGLAPRAAR